MTNRNPSSPSHLTMAQVARILELCHGSVQNKVKTGKLPIETHFGTKMVPMWAVIELQSPNHEVIETMESESDMG